MKLLVLSWKRPTKTLEGNERSGGEPCPLTYNEVRLDLDLFSAHLCIPAACLPSQHSGQLIGALLATLANLSRS